MSCHVAAVEKSLGQGGSWLPTQGLLLALPPCGSSVLKVYGHSLLDPGVPMTLWHQAPLSPVFPSLESGVELALMVMLRAFNLSVKSSGTESFGSFHMTL